MARTGNKEGIGVSNENGIVKVDAEFSVNNNAWIPDNAKKSYHDQRLSQSKWAFRVSLWGSILGFIIIAVCLVVGVWRENIAWVGTASGIVVESVSALFYYLSNKTNEKITEFFKELTADANTKESLKLLDKISDDVIKDNLTVKLSLHLAGIDEDKICRKTIEVCSMKTE